MSLSNAQAMYSNSQPVQQAPGGGGGNRYIPPTFNYRQNTGNPYAEMDWNNVQNYNLPQQGNNPFTQQYMGGLRESLGGFGGRYPRQQPVMPQFGGGRGGFDPMRMMMQMYQGMGPEQLFGFGGRGGRAGPNSRGGGGYDDYVANFRPEGIPDGMVRDMSVQPGRDMPFSREEWEARQNQGGGRWGDSIGYGLPIRNNRGGGGYEDLIAQFYSRLYPQAGKEPSDVKPNYIDPVKPYGG